MNLYTYEGPVLYFGRITAIKWVGQTTAQSEKRAKSNLAYRFKKEMKLMPTAKIEMPGKLYCQYKKEA